MLCDVIDAICTYENGNVLEAVPRAAIVRQRLRILQNKRDFNDSCHASGHKGIAKHGVRHGANHQLLRVRRHAPASDEDDESRDEVALRVAVAVPAQPNTGQTSTPPNNSHCSVLPIILDPCGTPAMLSEGVDAAPDSDNGAVIKLLRPSRAADPDLSRKEDDGQKDAISDECTTHDEVSSALANVVPLAETKGGDTSKDHLHPGEKRHRFSNNGVEGPDKLPNHAEDALLPMELQV